MSRLPVNNADQESIFNRGQDQDQDQDQGQNQDQDDQQANHCAEGATTPEQETEPSTRHATQQRAENTCEETQDNVR